MDTSNEHELVNWKLFKQLRYNYIIFDANPTKITERNGYLKSFMIALVFFISLLLFASSGYFIELEYTIKFYDFVQTIYAQVHCYIMLYNMVTLINKSKKCSDLLDVSNFSFLKSNLCDKNKKILHKHRDQTIKLSNIYCIVLTAAVFQWIMFPLMMEILMPVNRETTRIRNVGNYLYPVSLHTYNTYFIVFYGIELFFAMVFLYSEILTDFFVLLFGWTIVYQYRVINQTFADIGHKLNTKNYDSKKYYDELISVIHDLIRVDRKMKIYFSIVKPIVTIYVALASFVIIILTFVLLFVLKLPELDTHIAVLKLVCTVLFTSVQLSVYCNLFDVMNSERESVSFGLYSCNWTMMDLKFKKLILLAMRTNDANKLILKFSPRKIIDMQLYSSLLTTSFNIVSVMLKTIDDENQKQV